MYGESVLNMHDASVVLMFMQCCKRRTVLQVLKKPPRILIEVCGEVSSNVQGLERG